MPDAGTVTVTSVTTADGAPTTAPHKISDKSGKTTATVAFKVDVGGLVPDGAAAASPMLVPNEGLMPDVGYANPIAGHSLRLNGDTASESVGASVGRVAPVDAGEDDVGLVPGSITPGLHSPAAGDSQAGSGDAASGATITETVTWDEVLYGADLDGDYTVSVWGFIKGQGWV